MSDENDKRPVETVRRGSDRLAGKTGGGVINCFATERGSQVATHETQYVGLIASFALNKRLHIETKQMTIGTGTLGADCAARPSSLTANRHGLRSCCHVRSLYARTTACGVE